MFFFYKKKREALSDLKKQVENLNEKISHFDQALTAQQEQGVRIEHVTIERLENLIFRLDKLDIKELSGSLNIGNNIRTTKSAVEELLLQENDESPNESEPDPNSDRMGQKAFFEHTQKGFRIKKS